MSKEKMRASRHNGRSGKHGVYDVKHNDRNFDVANSEHIDAERTKLNVYWDCYQGYCLNGDTSERKMTFTEIEKAYYFEHYGDHVDAQNERNEKAGHAERNRTTDDVLKNNKTCPEESILQLGNIDCSVTPDVLAKVVAEFFEEFEKRYGSHVHILDWALHLDEATPHVHVRQVYDALNKYGELCPQQEKALEELGFELPDPTKKRSRFKYDGNRNSASRFMALIDKYERFEELTPAMINEFVEKVLVHERDRKGSIQTTQEIEIYFNFLGRYVPPVMEVELTPEEQAEIDRINRIKDKRHQQYLRRKESGWQRKYEERVKSEKREKLQAMKEEIRKQDRENGVYATVGSLALKPTVGTPE